jgi:hypothetical protein
MDWITDMIAIGNLIDAEKPDKRINHILCLKPDCCKGRTDIKVTCIPLVDGPGNRRKLYKMAVNTIRSALEAKEHILVHCHAGRSRSVAVVARYLMEFEGLNRDQAIRIIADKREICLSDGIEDAFREV